MSILSHSSTFVVVGCVIIVPLVQGPAGPVCTAAAWSPALCRKPASKSHEVPSGWAGSCDVPNERIVEKKSSDQDLLMSSKIIS